MQQQRNMGITGNYMQYGTNFWNNTIRTKATSIDALHFLIKSISELNDTPDNPFKIDNLYDERKDLITIGQNGVQL